MTAEALSRRAGNVANTDAVLALDDDWVQYANAVLAAPSFDALAAQWQVVIEDGEAELAALDRQAVARQVEARHLPGGHEQLDHGNRDQPAESVAPKTREALGGYGHSRAGEDSGSKTPPATFKNAAKALSSVAALPEMKVEMRAALTDQYDDPATAKAFRDTVGNRGDFMLAAIVAEQGFDAKPDHVSRDELDAYVKAGEAHWYRGISDTGDYASLSDGNPMAYARQFVSGDVPYQGYGIFGTGTYVATGAAIREFSPAADTIEAKELAEEFAGGKHPGVIVEGTLKRDARVIEWDKLEARAERQRENGSELGNAGRLAAALGYDAIHIPLNSVATGWVGQQYIILNRGAVRVVDPVVAGSGWDIAE